MPRNRTWGYCAERDGVGGAGRGWGAPVEAPGQRALLSCLEPPCFLEQLPPAGMCFPAHRPAGLKVSMTSFWANPPTQKPWLPLGPPHQNCAYSPCHPQPLTRPWVTAQILYRGQNPGPSLRSSPTYGRQTLASCQSRKSRIITQSSGREALVA